MEVTLPGGEKAGERIKLPAMPLEMDHRKFGLRHDLPKAGENTTEVLTDLGFSEAEIRSLLEDDLARSGRD